MQIQALLAKGAGGREERGEGGVKVAKPQIFNGTSAKVEGFISACKLYIRMRMRGESVEGQVQWMLSYIQRGSADVWKENIMEEQWRNLCKNSRGRLEVIDMREDYW